MQRIQTYRVLIVVCITSISACNQVDVPTVTDYLHDLDAARNVLKISQTNPAKHQNDPATMNASAAMAKAMAPDMLVCWPIKPASTSTTDHGCLESKGFKR